MSDRGDSEATQIRLGLDKYDKSPWEYGAYVERNDGRNGEDGWTPIVYGGMRNWGDARKAWMEDCGLSTSHPEKFRNPRIVRRAVSPWEVYDR